MLGLVLQLLARSCALALTGWPRRLLLGVRAIRYRKLRLAWASVSGADLSAPRW
jgi:hypothetical protein